VLLQLNTFGVLHFGAVVGPFRTEPTADLGVLSTHVGDVGTDPPMS
jgi:hypothetical protein